MRIWFMPFAAFVTLAAPAYAVDPSLADSRRVVDWSWTSADAKPFFGVSVENFNYLATENADSPYLDAFRTDVITIWAASTESKWHILPPKPLGRGVDEPTADTPSPEVIELDPTEIER